MPYVDLLRSQQTQQRTKDANLSIPVKPVTLLHGEPYIRWTESEVKKMDIMENLQYAIVGKFSYG